MSFSFYALNSICLCVIVAVFRGHPSTTLTCSTFQGWKGAWCFFPPVIVKRRGVAWTGRQSIAGHQRDRRDKQLYTHRRKDNFCDTRENMQTPDRKTTGRDLNPGPLPARQQCSQLCLCAALEVLPTDIFFSFCYSFIIHKFFHNCWSVYKTCPHMEKKQTKKQKWKQPWTLGVLFFHTIVSCYTTFKNNSIYQKVKILQSHRHKFRSWHHCSSMWQEVAVIKACCVGWGVVSCHWVMRWH